MTARLYEVTATVMRDGFTRAVVTTHHVAAPTRQRAIKLVRESLWLRDSNAHTISTKCLGSRVQTKYRCLRERQP